MTETFLPYGRQSIDEQDISAVADALRADFLTTGPRVEEFERSFAAATGAAHAVACNSGTAALHLAALALDLQPGRAAVVPTLTFLSTANVVRMCGAEVVFADVDPSTGLMTPDTFSAALDRKEAADVTAAFPVHLNGLFCDMAGIEPVAQTRAISLAEDACHALGSLNAGSTSHSSMACFSTHPVKAIATGEGGVVTTANGALAARMRQLRSHGMTREQDAFQNSTMAFSEGVPNPWYYEMPEIGWNYRLPDILCALGVSQLTKLDRFAARRREIASLYDRLLEPLAPAIRPVPHGNQPHGWHLYVILIDFDALGITRARVMSTLKKRGVGTQVHYVPVHHQPYYRARYGKLSLPGADAYYARCLSIPMFPDMTDDNVHRVVAVLGDIVSGRV